MCNASIYGLVIFVVVIMIIVFALAGFTIKKLDTSIMVSVIAGFLLSALAILINALMITVFCGV